MDQIKQNQMDIQTLAKFIAQNGQQIQQSSEEMHEFREEMRLSREKSAKEMKEFKEEMSLSREKSAKEMKEFKDEMKEFKDEMKKSRDNSNKAWGNLANRMGTVIEDIIVPNVDEAILNAFNLEVDGINSRVKRNSGKGKDRMHIEIDVLATSGKEVFLIETKTTMSSDYVDKFKEKVESGNFHKFFPEYQGYKITQILASILIDEDLRAYIKSKGMYPMVMKGSIMEIIV